MQKKLRLKDDLDTVILTRCSVYDGEISAVKNRFGKMRTLVVDLEYNGTCD